MVAGVGLAFCELSEKAVATVPALAGVGRKHLCGAYALVLPVNRSPGQLPLGERLYAFKNTASGLPERYKAIGKRAGQEQEASSLFFAHEGQSAPLPRLQLRRPGGTGYAYGPRVYQLETRALQQVSSTGKKLPGFFALRRELFGVTQHGLVWCPLHKIGVEGGTHLQRLVRLPSHVQTCLLVLQSALHRVDWNGWLAVP